MVDIIDYYWLIASPQRNLLLRKGLGDPNSLIRACSCCVCVFVIGLYRIIQPKPYVLCEVQNLLEGVYHVGFILGS